MLSLKKKESADGNLYDKKKRKDITANSERTASPQLGEVGRPLSLTGEVSEIIYANEQNGYTVCEIITPDGAFTATGEMPYLSAGEGVTVSGMFILHPEYGRQFKVSACEKKLPVGEEAIYKYLASGALKGVGAVTAERIVKKYGDDTFDVMDKHPEWLAEISGITLKKAKTIGESFKSHSGMRSVMLFCGDFFGAALSAKIYKRYGTSAVDMIKSNPYRLASDIDGIGFEKADEVARRLGIGANSAFRTECGILHILSYNSYQNGHTCLPREKLIAAASEFLAVANSIISDSVTRMCWKKELVSCELEGVEFIFKKSLYESEKACAKRLREINKRCVGLARDDTDKMIESVEYESSITYSPVQRHAIEAALGAGVFVLTGGPGTGKTTVIRAIIRIMSRLGLNVLLCAPTGRAAKRMSEAASEEAKTVHRALEMEYSEDRSDDAPRFMRDKNNPLDADAVILDEASMLDLHLATALFAAIKPGARLVLVGDVNQLPPVGCGAVLDDIIASRKFNVIALDKIFRQSEKSYIITNAHAINEGKMPEISRNEGDFFFMKRINDNAVLDTISELCEKRLPKAYGDEIIPEIQVICPSRRGLAGAESLNHILQSALNPPSSDKDECRSGERIFRVGDKVMQTKNNYNIDWILYGKEGTGIYNGDIGFIREIDKDGQFMMISFDEREVKYDFALLPDLDHAYAITVHKSQGSEYGTVIMPVVRCAPMLLARSLLYTAVTRAKKMLILVGDQGILAEMVNNNRTALRYTGLRCLINADT